MKITKRLFNLLTNITITLKQRAILTNDGRYDANRVYKLIWDDAAQTSAEFVKPFLTNSFLWDEKTRLWDHATSKIAQNDCVVLEFGVFQGSSINHMARNLPTHQFFGFDSFRGLREDWPGHGPKGTFDLGATLPEVMPNVTLIDGWIQETLPTWVKNHDDKIGLIHIDTDTYETARDILTMLKSRIKSGTLIIFDEFIGVPNWQNAEYLAWIEFAQAEKLTFEYVGFSNAQVLINVTSTAN
jgi:hypothetical protein